jgi:hypothetical protein
MGQHSFSIESLSIPPSSNKNTTFIPRRKSISLKTLDPYEKPAKILLSSEYIRKIRNQSFFAAFKSSHGPQIKFSRPLAIFYFDFKNSRSSSEPSPPGMEGPKFSNQLLKQSDL